MKIRNALIVWLFVAALAIVPASSQVTTTISAPDIVDQSLVPGSYVPIDITVADVEDLWGFQFVLSWDPTVLNYFAYAKQPPFVSGGLVETGPGWLAYNGYIGLGDPGVSGSMKIVTFYAQVAGVGGTVLDLNDVGMIDSSGAPILAYSVIDGFFANIEVAHSVELRRCIAEHQNWFETRDSENILHAKAKNKGTVATNAYVEFIIEDEGGVMYAEVETDNVLLKPNKMHDFTMKIDRYWLIAEGAPLPGYGTYYVHVEIHYYVGGGVWGEGKQTMKFHFTLYADVPEE